MDKSHTRYAASYAGITRVENGFVVLLRLWDNEIILVAEGLAGVCDILQRIDWTGAPRRLKEPEPSRVTAGPPLQAESSSPDETTGMSAGRFLSPHA